MAMTITLAQFWFAFTVTSAALSGPPAPRVNANVWRSIPLGARVRVEITANCMGRIPAQLDRKLQLLKGGVRIRGRWVYEKKFLLPTGSKLRLAFVPARPLGPGAYTVGGLPKARLGWWFPRPAKVTVKPTPDRKPPVFKGLKGIYCVRPHPLIGCRGRGLYLKPAPIADHNPTRHVIYIRKRRRPYTSSMRWEGRVIPFWTRALGANFKPGRYIVTMRAVDASDNEGGRVCEVAVTLPAKSTCTGFPKAKSGRGFHVFGGSGLVPARCARWDRRRKRWISRIDGVGLKFQGTR